MYVTCHTTAESCRVRKVEPHRTSRATFSSRFFVVPICWWSCVIYSFTSVSTFVPFQCCALPKLAAWCCELEHLHELVVPRWSSQFWHCVAWACVLLVVCLYFSFASLPPTTAERVGFPLVLGLSRGSAVTWTSIVLESPPDRRSFQACPWGSVRHSHRPISCLRKWVVTQIAVPMYLHTYSPVSNLIFLKSSFVSQVYHIIGYWHHLGLQEMESWHWGH